MRLARRLIPAALALLILVATHSSGHEAITTKITFSREISRVFYSRCVECHRPGGAAFSLVTYEEARPWARAILEEVLERRMPPWAAVKGFGDFRDDQALTQEQVELIAEWVEGGAPDGDPKYLPQLPEFRSRGASVAVTGGLPVDGSLTLPRATTVTGIRARSVPDGSSYMAVARLPDGSIEPLVWMYNYQKKFDRTYWYKSALRLPAGARVEVTPRDAGGIELLIQPSRKTTARR